LIAVLLTAASCSAWGQVLRFQHLGVEDGLSSPVVNCLLEDRSGVIWIGTDRGLDRYDGQRVDPVTGTAWPAGNTVTALAEHPDGTLWIGTAEAGLGRYNAAAGTMVMYDRASDPHHAWPSDRINHVLVIDEGTVLVCTRDAGAFLFDPGTRACIPVRTGFTVDATSGDTLWQQGARWVIGATRLDTDRAWLAMTNDKRAPVVHVRTGALLEEWPSLSQDTISIFSNALLDGDTLFAGSWGPGLHAFPLHDPQHPRHSAIREQITAMAPWTNGGIIMGTEHQGLMIRNADSHITRVRRERFDQRSLRSDHIRCLLTDRAGNLWVGTTNGVSVHAPAVHRNMEIDLLSGISDPNAEPLVHALSEEPDGRIRIATSLGFMLVSTTTGELTHIPVAHRGRSLEPTTMLRISDEEAFIGTETGVFRYDAMREQVLDLPGLPDERSHFMAHGMYQVRDMQRIDHGGRDQLLLNALGWAPRIWDPVEGRWSTPPQPKDALPYVTGIAVDGSGGAWFTTASGVYQVPADRDTMILQRETRGTAFNSVFSGGTSMWAATSTGALHDLMNGHEAKPPSHLADELVGAIGDQRGDIWCATVNGLLRYRRNTAEWLRMPLAPGGSFARIKAAPLILHDGRIALCTGTTLLLIDPATLDDLPPMPAPLLRAVNGTTGHPPVIRLSYRAATLDVLLSALQPTGAAPLLFLYAIDGVDHEARITDARNAIHYTGLPPGEHTLHVQVRDAYGRTGPRHALLRIRVAAPFWVTWWFYALLAAFAVLITLLWSRYKQRQLLAVHAMRDRIANDLHDEVGSALSSITIGSRLAQRMSGSTNGKLEQLLHRMGETSDASLRSISDIVWAIDPKNDEGEALLDRMRTIAVELLEHQGIDVRWTISGDVAGMKLPMDVRKDVLLIFKEAIHNISKHAHASTVQVEVARTPDQLRMRISDDGKGFDASLTGSGHGLSSMQQRAANIRATWSLTSSPSHGTQLEVRLPLARTRQ